jgi:hypothetical protein
MRSRRRSAARQCRRCADTNASQAARTPPAATSSSHRKSIASCARWPSRPTRSVSWWSWSCALAGRLPFDKDSAACSAWSRHTTTVKNDASCSRRPETATRNMARAIPPSTVAEQLLEVNGAFSIGPPKSAAGRRTVTLPAVVVEALAEQLRRYTAESPEASVFLSRRRLAARGDGPAGPLHHRGGRARPARHGRPGRRHRPGAEPADREWLAGARSCGAGYVSFR